MAGPAHQRSGPVWIATQLLTAHAYGGETVWFYERLSAACAEHRQALPFWPG